MMSGPDPVVVDLDGSLLRTDLLYESVIALVRANPLIAFRLPFWLMKGRAYLKRQVAERVEIDVSNLPVNESVLAFVRESYASAKTVILATASDALLAEKVAERFGFFSSVIASDGATNLKGLRKLDAIRSALESTASFEYVGDSRADLAIFREASRAHLVNPSSGLLKAARETAHVGMVFSNERENQLRVILKTLRVHQWVKNVLLFLPSILAHEVLDPGMVNVLLGFAAFSLVASGGYVVNDLLDLEADRLHPSNKSRPIASGQVSLPAAIALMSVCLGAGLLLSAILVPWPFTAVLGLYLALSIGYSFYLKHLVVVDVLVLASLYSIRIIAGGIAASVYISGWLISFSVFFFLGLALLKRYVEFSINGSETTPGSARAYSGNDVTIVGTFGMISGMLAILVFVLYLNSPDVVVLYTRPRLLWWVNIPLIYWTMRMWLNASRGLIHSDPIVSALKDPVSYVCGGATAVLLFLAIG